MILKKNKNISACFCIEHKNLFNMPCRGIQVSGECLEIKLRDVNFEKYKKSYLLRFQDSEKMFESHFIYKISLNKLVLFDEINFPENDWQTIAF